MLIKLKRYAANHDGVLGKLFLENGHEFCFTLEHSYDSGLGNGSYTPKVPVGAYKCIRSQHRLHSSTASFETFEVKGVPEHKGILFHTGNWNDDSDGCILLGNNITTTPDAHMITNSRATFKKFMELLTGFNEFTLVVEETK